MCLRDYVSWIYASSRESPVIKLWSSSVGDTIVLFLDSKGSIKVSRNDYQYHYQWWMCVNTIHNMDTMYSV